MTESNKRALDSVANSDDPLTLRKWIAGALREGDREVELAARRRLAEVASSAPVGTVENEFWGMVETVEQLRRDHGRSNWRMNYLRRSESAKGPTGALAACVKRETDGFREVVGYGLVDLTAEAIVLRHSAKFDEETLQRAEVRLASLDPPHKVERSGKS